MQEAAQDAVLVQGGDLVQTRQGAVGQLGHPLGSGRAVGRPECRVEAGLEELHQPAGE